MDFLAPICSVLTQCAGTGDGINCPNKRNIQHSILSGILYDGLIYTRSWVHHFTMFGVFAVYFQFLRIYYLSFDVFDFVFHCLILWLKFPGKLIFYAINFGSVYWIDRVRCGNTTGFKQISNLVFFMPKVYRVMTSFAQAQILMKNVKIFYFFNSCIDVESWAAFLANDLFTFELPLTNRWVNQFIKYI